jgi:hypothetical protein
MQATQSARFLSLGFAACVVVVAGLAVPERRHAAGFSPGGPPSAAAHHGSHPRRRGRHPGVAPNGSPSESAVGTVGEHNRPLVIAGLNLTSS